MKAFLISIASKVAVGLAFLELGAHGQSLALGQKVVLISLAMLLLNVLFVPRWPKTELLRVALSSLRLKRGEKVEVEGK